jgi:hypothetical protein
VSPSLGVLATGALGVSPLVVTGDGVVTTGCGEAGGGVSPGTVVTGGGVLGVVAVAGALGVCSPAVAELGSGVDSAVICVTGASAAGVAGLAGAVTAGTVCGVGAPVLAGACAPRRVCRARLAEAVRRWCTVATGWLRTLTTTGSLAGRATEAVGACERRA